MSILLISLCFFMSNFKFKKKKKKKMTFKLFANSNKQTNKIMNNLALKANLLNEIFFIFSLCSYALNNNFINKYTNFFQTSLFFLDEI